MKIAKVRKMTRMNEDARAIAIDEVGLMRSSYGFGVIMHPVAVFHYEEDFVVCILRSVEEELQ